MLCSANYCVRNAHKSKSINSNPKIDEEINVLTYGFAWKRDCWTSLRKINSCSGAQVTAFYCMQNRISSRISSGIFYLVVPRVTLCDICASFFLYGERKRKLTGWSAENTKKIDISKNCAVRVLCSILLLCVQTFAATIISIHNKTIDCGCDQ